MAADQIATIRPFIGEVIDGAAVDPDSDYCATFEVTGAPELWVQYTVNTVNSAYNRTHDPMETLRQLGLDTLLGLALCEWQPELFVTFTHDPAATTREIARFIDGVFVKLLACDAEYSLDVSIENLG